MRLKGKLKSWNDDRGFGFIEPIEADQEIFVHIKAFGPRRGRPQLNELLWFDVEVGPEGKKRASNVELVRKNAARDKVDRESSDRGAQSLCAIPGFVLVYLLAVILWGAPIVLASIYIVASFVTFVVYAHDKSAAKQGAQRTPENMLHLLAFAGGWPGALLAQQILRHKTKKVEFRAVFWGTVILNVTGFVLFCSQIGQTLWTSK